MSSDTNFSWSRPELRSSFVAKSSIERLSQSALYAAMRLVKDEEAQAVRTWLGNKAIYRTRMALADGGELIIMAPGVDKFGEDPAIDTLIRKYGYRGTDATLEMVKNNADLAAELSAAAHLIHGSSEGRFRITWCPGNLSRIYAQFGRRGA